MEGTTDTDGGLKIKGIAAAAGETPGANDGRESEPGVTDSKGSVMAKFYGQEEIKNGWDDRY